MFPCRLYGVLWCFLPPFTCQDKTLLLEVLLKVDFTDEWLPMSSLVSDTYYSIHSYTLGNKVRLEKVVIYAKGFSLVSRYAAMILELSYGPCLITSTDPRRHLLIMA